MKISSIIPVAAVVNVATGTAELQVSDAPNAPPVMALEFRSAEDARAAVLLLVAAMPWDQAERMRLISAAFRTSVEVAA